jgi:alpha-amylase
MDGDGRDEIVLSNPLISLFIKPDDGGSLFELDYKPVPFNFCNLLTRRDEYYHDALRSAATQVEDRHEQAKSIHDIANAKEQGLEQFLVCDPYRRVSLRDHIYPPDVDTLALWQCTQPEWSDLYQTTYQVEESEVSILMHTSCYAGPAGKTRISIHKTITIPPDASDIEIRYDISHVSGLELNATFATELGFNFLAGAAHDRYYFADTWEDKHFQLNALGSDDTLQHIGMRDEWMGLSAELRLDTPALIHRFPLETVSNSEGGQERVYQGSMLVPCWALNLKPGESKVYKVSVALRQNK